MESYTVKATNYLMKPVSSNAFFAAMDDILRVKTQEQGHFLVLKSRIGVHKMCIRDRVTIQPGSSLGYHEHKNESETYYILSGTAEYNDNGTTRTVKAGDVTYTPDGCGHALKPIGNEPVVFMALIIFD